MCRLDYIVWVGLKTFTDEFVSEDTQLRTCISWAVLVGTHLTFTVIVYWFRGMKGVNHIMCHDAQVC